MHPQCEEVGETLNLWSGVSAATGRRGRRGSALI
jgi:hypothetical protein